MYKFIKDIITEQNVGVRKILEDGTTLQIPFSEDNTHYQEWVEWSKTNTTEAAD